MDDEGESRRHQRGCLLLDKETKPLLVFSNPIVSIKIIGSLNNSLGVSRRGKFLSPVAVRHIDMLREYHADKDPSEVSRCANC